MTDMPTAAIYCRISKDKSGAGLGVARQEAECKALAERLGLQVHDDGIFIDNDLSASTLKPRPSYLRMLNAINDGKFDAVVVWHLDRLTRRTSELDGYLEVATAIPTYAVQGGSFDLTSPPGRATAKTVTAWAQAEVELKSERQKSKNAQTVRDGGRLGGPVPFGYRKDRLTLHPTQGPLLKQAYLDVLEGKKVLAIVREWNDAGVTTLRGGPWTRTSVRTVLLRPSNAGLVTIHGKVVSGVVGAWTPVVSIKDFYSARAILTDPARRTTPGSPIRHFLTGIAVCANCGSALGRLPSRTQASSYACKNTRAHGGTCAAGVSIRQDVLDRYIEERFLAERGSRPGITVKVVDSDAEGIRGATLTELDERIRGVALQMAEPDADTVSLVATLTDLKAERSVAEAAPVGRRTDSVLTVAQSWSPDLPDTALVVYRRQMLKAQLAPRGLRVKSGRGVVTARVSIEWVD